MTNKELGDAVKVSESMASRIRNGQRLPSVKVLVALSEQLNIRLARLIDAHLRGPQFFGEVIRHAIDKKSQ